VAEHPAVEVPDRLFDDDAAEARWRGRFSAPRVSLPRSARDAQDRSLYLSNTSGVWEVYAWDRATGTHRQVTNRPNGTYNSTLPPDGERVWWFADTDGDEFGHWVSEPFHDGPATSATPAVDGVPDGYPAGLEIGISVVAVGTATDDGSTIWVSADGAQARVVYQHKEDAHLAAMSRDQQLLAISHSEHGDSRHPAVRVVRASDGASVAEKWDGEGRGLHPLEFSPVAGDQRLLLTHERRGREELLIWDVATDTETELTLDLPGELTASWYPDGAALLVGHTHSARITLHRYDVATATLSTVDTLRGAVAGAEVRDDGSIEYSWSSGAQPPQVRVLAQDGIDRVLLTPPGEAAEGSVELTDAWVDGPGGRVHALVARPGGASEDRPLPAVFFIHGGPQAADEDRFSPVRAAWVDAGFAVVHVNYRGSTGYGSGWRDAIEGRPGLTELDDIAAVYDWAVASGLADPDRIAISGYSWGGYLTLLALGTQPERWAAGVAGVPVADYVTAYADEMEPLRAFDRALFGGSPDELHGLYERCSPLTYVDAVNAPVLVLAGENDPRCPIRQVDNYLDALAVAGKKYAVYRYDAGHGSLVVAETLRQVTAEINFVRATLATG
jgi:dipeptidyl aminopeptidase/acylaminoacyl peptidase